MKYNDLDLTNYLDKYNFARILNVVLKGKNSYFNLCKTIRIANVDTMLPRFYTNYQVTAKDTWTNISFKFYGTYKLWWLICKFNNIEDPFTELELGIMIKIPTNDVVRNIILNLDTF